MLLASLDELTAPVQPKYALLVIVPLLYNQNRSTLIRTLSFLSGFSVLCFPFLLPEGIIGYSADIGDHAHEDNQPKGQ